MFWKKQKDEDTLGEIARLFRSGYIIMPVADIPILKRALIKPYLELEWAKQHAKDADKINRALESKGEEIRQARDQYREDLLAAQREGKDTKLIEAKLDILNRLVEDV
jgi:hypothetical protein